MPFQHGAWPVQKPHGATHASRRRRHSRQGPLEPCLDLLRQGETPTAWRQAFGDIPAPRPGGSGCPLCPSAVASAGINYATRRCATARNLEGRGSLWHAPAARRQRTTLRSFSTRSAGCLSRARRGCAVERRSVGAQPKPVKAPLPSPQQHLHSHVSSELTRSRRGSIAGRLGPAGHVRRGHCSVAGKADTQLCSQVTLTTQKACCATSAQPGTRGPRHAFA